MKHGRAWRSRRKHGRVWIAATTVLFTATVGMVASTLAVQPASAALVPALHGKYTSAQFARGSIEVASTRRVGGTTFLDAFGIRVPVPSGCPASDFVGYQFAPRGAPIVSRYGSFDTQKAAIGGAIGADDMIKGRISRRGTIVGTYRATFEYNNQVCDTGVVNFTARRVSRR